MPDPVWTTIDNALKAAKPPRTWAWLAVKLGATDQVVNNWQRRQVPSSRHSDIARILGWSVEDLLAGGPDSAPSAEEIDRWRMSLADEPMEVDGLGSLSKMVAKLVSGLSPSRRKTISHLFAAQIAEGPLEDEAKAIDALAPGFDFVLTSSDGRTTTVEAKRPDQGYRDAVNTLARKHPKPAERVKLMNFLREVDAYLAEQAAKSPPTAQVRPPSDPLD